MIICERTIEWSKRIIRTPYAFRFRKKWCWRSSVEGTVKVNEKFKVEKYSHVMHIVSNVYGKFKKIFHN